MCFVYRKKLFGLATLMAILLAGCDSGNHIDTYQRTLQENSYITQHSISFQKTSDPKSIGTSNEAIDQGDAALQFIKQTAKGRKFLKTVSDSFELYLPLYTNIDTIEKLLSDPNNYVDATKVSDKLTPELKFDKLLKEVRKNNIKAAVLYEMQKLSNSFVIAESAWDSYLKGNLERDYNALLVATADTFTTEQSIYVTNLYTKLQEDISYVIEKVLLMDAVLTQK